MLSGPSPHTTPPPSSNPLCWPQVLSWLSFGDTSVTDCVRRQLRILAFYYWSTYSILQARRNAYMHVQPPKQLHVADGADV